MGAQLSGSVGGVTASHNKGGQYLRNRSVPTNPNSQRQQLVRGAIAAAATSWQALTPGQRAAWEGYAEETPVTNRLGESITVSGWNMYCRMVAFFTSADAAASIVSDAPLVPGLVEFDAGVTVSMAVTLGVAVTGIPAALDGPMLVSIGPALSPGVSYFRGPFTAFLAVVDGSAIDGVLTPGNQAANRYGLPLTTQRRGVRIQGSSADGRLATAREFLATVF